MANAKTLYDDFEYLGLSEYFSRFADEGFLDWSAIADITENDLAYLGVRLGHRRILFRHIATLRGHAPTEPLDDAIILPSPVEGSSGPGRSELRFSGTGSGEDSLGPATSSLPRKRRYKRHPKADENAPQRPPSAYVMFANRVREEQKDANLNFTQLARLVGDRWKVLSYNEKESIESDAGELKRQYTGAVEEYKKSREYRLYQDYLVEFKERALRDEKPEKLEPPKKARRHDDTYPVHNKSASPSSHDHRLPDARSLLSISSIIDSNPSGHGSQIPSLNASASGFDLYHNPGHTISGSDSFSRRLPFPVQQQQHQLPIPTGKPPSMPTSHKSAGFSPFDQETSGNAR